MHTTTLIGLANNAALLLALGLLYDTIGLKRQSEKPSVQVLIGVILGAIGIAVMMTPWEFAPGVIFDTRSVLLSVGGLFFGSVPTLVAVLMTGLYRLYLGGGGAWTGVAVIATSGAMGVGWRYLRRNGLETVSSLELYILGIVVHIAMLLWMLSLPWSVAVEVLSRISLPVMTVYPVGTVLLGRLMTGRLERSQAGERLRESEERFRTVADVTHDWEYWIGPDGDYLYVSPSCKRITGCSAADFLQNPRLLETITHPDDTARIVSHVHEESETGEVPAVDFRIVTHAGDERWVAHVCQPVYSDDGRYLGRRASNRDITERVRAEEALRESEQRFRNHVEATQHLIWESDAEGRITYLNPAWEQVTGYSLSEVLGKSYFDFVAEEEVERERAEFAQYPEGNDDGYPTTYITKDGSEIYLIFSTVPLYDADRNIVGTLGSAFDITDRVRAEESLRESEARHRGLFDNSPISLWEEDFSKVKELLDDLRSSGVSDLRAHLKARPDITAHCARLVEIVDINKATVDLFEAGSKDEILGSLDRLFMDESLEIFREELCALYEGKEAFESEIVGRSLAGNLIDCVVKVTIAPGYEGSWSRVLVSVTDITERQRAEALLRESEERMELALQGADLGTWDWNVRTGDVTFDVRWAEMLGYTLDEIEPRLSTWQNLVHPDDLPSVLDILKAHLEGRTGFYETEYRMQLKSGDWACVLDKGRVIERDVDGKPVRACGTHFDITERVRAMEALRESKLRLEETLAELRETQKQMMQQERLAAVGQLSAGIAHDFNNILASIVLYTQMSLRMSELPPTIRKRLEVIAGEADRAADLVQQMLDFGRQAVLRRESLNLGPLLEKTVALLERTIPESIRIKLALEPGDYIINADPARVQQAMVNLALNARDAMPDGGEFHIALSRVEDGEIDCVDCGRVVGGELVQLTVRDTGTGIAPAVLPHIFEPFFTTRAPLGHGLGLAQVYGIVKQHGGHIEVETEAGLGTTFRLYWPALSVARSEANVQPDAAQGEGHTILVVEDNAPMRRALADVMDMLGYRVLEAANGREALAVCEQHADDISLALSDWVMPSMGGLALVRELEERQIALKVLMLTGHPLDRETRRTLPKSVVGWVLKPPSLEQLAEAVAQALAGSESR